jgi:hypothetical protein
VIAAVATGTLVPGLILGVIIGLVCMRSADNFKAQYNGKTPWGLPSWVWFLLGFFLGVIGGILYLIARTTTRQKLMQTTYSPPPYPSPPMAQQPWTPQTGTQSPPPPPTGSSQPYPLPMPPPVPPPTPASPSEQPPPSGS